MEVRGVSGVASHGFGVPPCSSTTRASKIKSFKFHSSFKNVPHMRLVMSHKVNCYEANPMFWGREFQSRHKHLNGVAPYKWPCKHTSSLFVCSVSNYGGNDVEDFKSVEKKVKKDIKLPDSFEVESLITTICDTTSIAEFKLNLAGFNLYIKRNLVTENVLKLAPNPPLSISAPVPVSNGSASSTSLTISKSKPSSDGIQGILDTATDEGLVILQSPMVGYFRRARTIKGKRAPPSCKEKQEVKEGQVLCYVEQLGGEIPIESDVSGEVIKILRKDGEPVGYGDALIAILPSFPGIKKLQ
ncbi:uncharacterized protein LOC110108178 isoform X2 [Dendrobium catenatum]|uniref:uncharacterized protein LOC110108178 isoform X2 n=1 Tax=Dendrobium catenatum TaxID=906689 RepID=UPI0009F6596D|nr:uncharacterized protein LOC110108178 isoform X2 [Dendrobium catenatum]